MQHVCREFSMPRSEEGTRAKGWILKNTRNGPVLNIIVCHHNDRYSIEVWVRSPFQDNTVSWVRIVNGVGKYVTESMPKEEEEKASEKPIAKARPRQKANFPFLFLFLKGNGSTLKHNDHTIISVMKCQKPSPDCNDMMKDECRKKRFDDAS